MVDVFNAHDGSKTEVEIIFQFHRLASSKTNQQQTKEY